MKTILILVGLFVGDLVIAGGKPTAKFHDKKEILNTYGVDLPIAISTPDRKKEQALVLLIPGSFFNDVDGNYPEILKMNPHMYSDLAKQLAEKGYTVLRYAKHGPGTGSVVTDPKLAPVHTTFAGRLLIAQDALQRLIQEADTGTPRVYRWSQ